MRAMDHEDWVAQGYDDGFSDGWEHGLWHAYCEMWQGAMLHHADILEGVIKNMKTMSYAYPEHEIAAFETEALVLREYAKSTIPFLP